MKRTSKYFLDKIIVGALETNCYIITDAKSKKSLIIDPGNDHEKIIDNLTENKFIPVGIINTHGHSDHIGANQALKEKYNIPLYIHEYDTYCLSNPASNLSLFTGQKITSPEADKILRDNDFIDLESMKIKVIHTPGHTPGGVCLMVENLLFTGDTLFCCSVGRCDLSGGDEIQLKESIMKIKQLNPELIILPGHGNGCILKEELKHNPFI